MIADVVFDAPVAHPFSYRVPPGWTVRPGQRVLAPLGGAERLGMVVALRDETNERLKPLLRLADSEPILSPAQLDLVHWIAAESLSSVGSTCAALLPPPFSLDSHRLDSSGRASGSAAALRLRTSSPSGALPLRAARDAFARHPSVAPGTAGGNAPAHPEPPPTAPRPEVLVGAGRERRLLERIAAATGPLLVLAADVETSARWAERLGKLDRVVRLDSGVPDAERHRAWAELAAGTARLATGTRSAVLAPLEAGATIALIDEHEATHKPPGPPRLHSRDIVLERAKREALGLVLTTPTPSVELWAAALGGHATLALSPPGPWPSIAIADTRGILRREPVTPVLARGVRETLAAGRRVLLLVSRLSSALACDECGAVVRCEACAIALAYARASAALACRLCGRSVPLPETCPACQGRRLTPFGWGAERVEHAVRRRFPNVAVARYDPDATRGARAVAQRAAAAAAAVVIGTRGALKLFGPGALGLVGFVTPDQLLRVPDFRAGERMCALLWAAAERVRSDGTLVIQTQHPTHYAFDAVARQDLAVFYKPELEFRSELGYPPFRRLAIVTVRAGSPADTERAAEGVAQALRAVPGTTVYPPAADRRQRVRRIVVKGPAELPRLLEPILAPWRARSAQRRGIIDVEVDPVEWPF